MLSSTPIGVASLVRARPPSSKLRCTALSIRSWPSAGVLVVSRSPLSLPQSTESCQVRNSTRLSERSCSSMERDEYLTSGLCPTCFCIHLSRHYMSYKPRPIADVLADCKIGCTFCGLLTFSLDLKFCMAVIKDISTAVVSLSRNYEHRGSGDQDCITAELSGYGSKQTANFEITKLHGQCEDWEDGKAWSNSIL